MAENQTATEDSGQQSQQHHQTQPQQQSQSPQQEHPPPAVISPTTQPQEHSASSPEDTQTIVIPHSNYHLHHNQHSGQVQEQPQSRSMIDRQISSKFKTSSTSSQRRNTIQTPTRTASTTAIKKPALTKMTSLTTSTTGGSVGGCSTGTGTGAGVANMHAESSKHHHYHHQHIHQHHNNTPNHHHSPSSGGGSSGSGSGTTNAVQRRTSESLRLHTSLAGGSTGESSASNLSNATSNSSLHSNSNLSNNSISSSTSVAPQSTTTTATATASTSKATSPNNNGGSSSTTNRGHHGHGHHHAASQPNRKPKTTSSFQITSVTVGHPKVHSDNGDESADDLDESHTDDNSRVTDLETEPSISEDTFSKEEVYFANSALSTTAPVIPTSSQYGLVMVDPVGPTLGQALQNVQVNVADNIINVVSAAVTPGGCKKKDDSKEAQQRSERFKVVKIESTEPFRRGRWMCMDYLDHSTVGTGGKEGGGGNSNEKTASSESGGGANGEPAKTTQSMIIGSGAATLLENHVDVAGNSLQLSSSSTAADGNWNFMEGSQNALQHQMSAPSGIATAPATVVHGMQQFVESTGGTGKSGGEGGTQPRQETQNQQQQQQQQPVYPDCANANAVQEVAHGQTMPMDYATAAAQQLQKSLQELKKREEAIAASEEAGTIYVPNQQQPAPQHGATLPSNLHFQNGSVAISSELPNSTNNPTQAQQPPPEQQTTEQPQPPIAPVLQNSEQSQVAPTFSAPQSGAFSQKQNFQSAQQTQQQQSPQIIPTDLMGLQAPQQQQQQQQPQQVPPQLQQQQQPTSQTDGVAPTMANVSSVQQQPQQQHQSSQFQQQSEPGQTMPIMSQMTNYDMQQHQATATTLPTAQSPPHMQQSAPATIADTNAIAAAIQQQQQQKPQAQTQPIQIDNTTLTTATVKVTNEPQSQSANILNNISVSANSNSTAASNTTTTVNTATTPLSNADEQQMTTQQPPQPSQLQQLQQNSETETESLSSLSQAIAYGSTRKRAFSTPHISPVIMSLLNTSASNVRRLTFKHKNSNNAAAHIFDSTCWPGQGRSDTNIYTNLALGHSRYKLIANPSDLDVDCGDDGEEEEAIDQFSPTIYPSSRAIPIPISAGNSPQHLPSGQQTPKLPSPTHLAYSASPATSGHLYSYFYNGSPEEQTPLVSMPPAKMSHSYDTAFGAAFNRLLLPQQQPTLPLLPGQQEGATSVAFATSPTSSLNSASGTSAVAIDNKIEQAMDLVKSHLMIAVREEVEVLKEKISELMDKINQLEVENTILKANMPQETLQQLQMQTQLQIAGTSVNTPAATTAVATNNMITPTPTPAPVQQLQPPATPTASAAESDANTNATAVVAATAAAAVTTSVTSGNTNVDTATATINGPLPSS